MKLAVIIDGSGFIYRAYYGYPQMLSPTGQPANAVYGVCYMLFALLSNFQYNDCVIALDRGRRTFRSDLYAEYKANRPTAPDDLKAQFSAIREAYDSFGLPVIDRDGYEADDIIASCVDHYLDNGFENVCIVSSDKDLMQLVSDNVYIYDPLKKKKIDGSGVYEKFGVYPNQIIDFLALLGDAADNVPGVDGIGIKTAAKLLNQYETIEGIYENIDTIKSSKIRESLKRNKDRLHLARKLVTLEHNTGIKDISDFNNNKICCSSLRCFCERYGFSSLLKKIAIQ